MSAGCCLYWRWWTNVHLFKWTTNTGCMRSNRFVRRCDSYFEIIWVETGVWSMYGDWSSCSVTCGEGYRFRKRDCLLSNGTMKKISYEHCIGKYIDIEPCNVTTCPSKWMLIDWRHGTNFVLLEYGPWSPWTPCSTFCGIGFKQRNRSCIPPGSNCGNYTFEQRACGEANCQRVVGKNHIFTNKNFYFMNKGIKETEADKYPLKGYLAIREGDIICVTKNNSGTIHHMANLVRSKLFFPFCLTKFWFVIKVCKSIGLTRGAQYGKFGKLSNKKNILI